MLLHVGERDRGCVTPACCLQFQAQMLRISTCVLCISHDTSPDITATHAAHASGLLAFTPAPSTDG